MKRLALLVLLLTGCATATPERAAIWRCYRVEDMHVDYTVECVCGDASMRCWDAR